MKMDNEKITIIALEQEIEDFDGLLFSRTKKELWMLDQLKLLRCDNVDCHIGRDILSSLYEAANQLPCCGLRTVVTAAIQEIQALREQEEKE